MRRIKSTTGVVALAVVFAAASFLFARARAGGFSQNAGSTVRISRLAAEFECKASALAEALAVQQEKLARFIEDPKTTESEILAQAESVIKSHGQLLRGVGQQVILLRGVLSPEGKVRLMELCTSEIRRHMCRLGRQGCCQGKTACDRCPGLAGCAGCPLSAAVADCGPGRGWSLKLSAEQIRMAGQGDRVFADQAAGLWAELVEKWSALLVAFECPSTADAELISRIDTFIEGHNNLDRAVAKYVVSLRGRLDASRQKWLIGLCRRPLQ